MERRKSKVALSFLFGCPLSLISPTVMLGYGSFQDRIMNFVPMCRCSSSLKSLLTR